jgi:hypothetical protein
MGNATNEKQWAAMGRLRFIEQAAYWRGSVNRQDLMTTFGISAAQATSDLQKFHELNPGALVYHLNRKRYEATQEMTCQLHEPRLEEALLLFLGASSATPPVPILSAEMAESPTVAVVMLPRRDAAIKVQRQVFQAVLHGLRLRVDYQTMSGKPAAWRWIVPHAFGHDGYRWHVRAWSEEGEHWGDFVLSRITKADWPVEKAAITGAKDLDWQTWIKLTLEPHRGMPVERRETISADYGMKNDRLTLRVRKAMLNYTLAHLRLPTDIGSDNEPVVSIVEKKIL